MVFEENFLRLTVLASFQKKKLNKWILQKREFFYYFLQSVSYNNVIVTIQIYFLPTFLKLWVHISNNIAGVVGGPEYYQKG